MTGAWGLSFLIWRTELVKPFSMQAVRRDLVVWEGVGKRGRWAGQGGHWDRDSAFSGHWLCSGPKRLLGTRASSSPHIWENRNQG